jgi:lipopolysaccharide transport system permease protein
VLAPLVLLPLVLVVAGLSWALGALGVYFRDIGQMMPPVVTALLFLSSAIIPLQNVPEDYLLVFQLNPLTLVIDQLRLVTLDGQLPELLPLLLYSGVALIVFVLGFAWFQRTRRGFADVL